VTGVQTCALPISDKLRPARLDGRVVLVVEAHPDGWMPLKLD
jgi:hypothetical protein